MGLITSRINLESLHSGRRRSHQGEDTLYSYSLNKNYFSNYFFMGGERFEVNDPDYLFGDSCDLNFLTCTKPYSLPYKKAQQNLLTNLNTKQKAINKVSSRVGGFTSPLNILTGRHRQVSQLRKQDAQTQTLNNNKSVSNGPEPSQPLVMLINIRKETLRLVKSSNTTNLDSDQTSLTRTASISNALPEQKNYHDSDSSSITSNTLSSAHSSATTSSTSKSGYTSVRDVPPSDCASDENDEYFEDALNEPANLSVRDDDDNDSEKNQQKSLLENSKQATKANCDIKITIRDEKDEDYEDEDEVERNTSDTENDPAVSGSDMKPKYLSGARSKVASLARNRKKVTSDKKLSAERLNSNRVYNIEFSFDAEVDCSIRVSYFCTREVNSSSVTYKPQHATYKSKTYTYKKGLNQKFEQQEHTFQPYLFDEDLLIYKPLDLDGNYNSGAVFPIVIHCAALEGPTPRQSQSLVATVEKSQLDDSYSIKPLKQLIFVDGVQYILQDIYGIENKPLTSTTQPKRSTSSSNRTPKLNRNLRSSCGSLYSLSNLGSNLNLSDSASMGSVVDSSLRNTQYRSLSENTFECVICMSEERDTMLLPCRHMCLCSSCAQSLRYQSSSCPICRCPFKAALNLRFIQRNNRSRSSLITHNEEHGCSGTTRRESLTNSVTPLLAMSKSSSAQATSSCGTAIEVHNTNTDGASLEMKPMRWSVAASGGSGKGGHDNNKCSPPQAEES